jgi:subtilisin family serine protease
MIGAQRQRRAAILLLAAIAILSCLLQGEHPEARAQGASTVPGQLLVRYRAGAAPEMTAAAGGASYNETLDLWRISVPDAAKTDELEAALRTDPDVELVQRPYIYVPAAEPDDALYMSKQHSHFRAINLQSAWEQGNPPNEVIVAVIDGGVDITHPELAARAWTNPAEAANGLDDDANGCVDDIHGCNFFANPPDGATLDQDGHGTFIAGLIAAERDNAAGVAGIASNARIMPVRALQLGVDSTTEQVAGAVLYAARNGADILNMSLIIKPEAGTCPVDPILGAAIQEAVEVHGASIFASTGNFTLDCVGYPASHPLAIAVAASGPAEDSDSHAFFSHWGPEVDLAAPGMGLVSTCPIPTLFTTPFCTGAPYGEGDGTSFSTPIVAGVAALVLGREPGLTPAEVGQRLRDTARNVPDENRPNWDGAGIVDAGAAIGAGSVWSSIDLRGDGASTASLRAVVGNPAAPDCEARIWNSPAFLVRTVSSSAGAGECGPYWPPTPQRPWRLIAAGDGPKAQVLNRWSLTSDGLSCSAPGMPATIPVGTPVQAEIDCANGGRIDNDAKESPRWVPIGALPRRYVQDVRYATASGDLATPCAPSLGRTVWYRIPAGTAADISADTFGAGFDTVLAVYRDGGGGNLAHVTCNDNYGILNPQSRVVWRTDGTSDYLVMAGAYSLVPAVHLALQFSEAAIPANDEDAVPVAVTPGAPAPFIQPAHSATTDEGDPDFSCAGIYGTSLWFSVTAPADGPLTVATAGSNYNTVMAAFDDGTEVACNNNAGPGDTTSRATWNAVAGREYRVVVGSFLGRPGGTLLITASGP